MKNKLLTLIAIFLCTNCFSIENENFKFGNFKNNIVSHLNINTIFRQLHQIEDTAKDVQKVQEQYSIKLTNDLEKQLAPKFINYQPDSLLVLLQWAESFKYYAEVDANHQMLFEVINTFWMNYIANKLNTYYQANNDIKHTFKFKYLRSSCMAQQFNVPINNTSSEKVLGYFTESKYSYLYDRFSNGTSFLFKASLFLLVLITLLSYFALFRSTKRRIIKKKI